jgi:PAS domain S-box-containing protein
MPAHIAVLDQDGVILAVNAAWVNYAHDNKLPMPMAGVGVRYVDVCRPAASCQDPDAMAVTDALCRLLEGRQTVAFQHDYLCPHPADPTRDRWFHLTLVPFRVGDAIHIMMSHEDVTEKYVAQRTQQLLERAIDQVSAGVVITDADGVIKYINDGFCKISGYSREETLGKTPRILKSGKIPPEDYAQMWNTITSGQTWRGVVCNRRKDGRFYWENQTISPMIDPAGVITHYVAVKEDVTESHQQFLLHSGLVRSSSDIFLLLDQQGLILEWSPKAATMFGVDEESAKGRHFSELVMTREACIDFENQLRKFLDAGSAPMFDKPRRFDLRHSDGEVFPADISLAAVDLDGEWRFTGFVRDMTETVIAQQQLVQAQKMEAIGQLSGGMAHDFNNILSIVAGSLDLLIAQLGEENRFLNIAREATTRATDVTRSLMSVARRRPLNPVSLDVNAAIRELGPLLRQTAGKSITLELLTEGPAPRLLLEPTGLNNALVNLVVNAKDAMPKGGRLLIYTYTIDIAEEFGSLGLDLTRGKYLVIGVDDSGEGMTPEVASKAFEPFFTTKELGKGTGFGLAMVYGYCRQSGGLARIESTPGNGCSVQLVLPIISTPPVDDGDGHGFEGAVESARILLVDDDPDLLQIARHYLRSVGYEVYVAKSPAKALGMIAKQHFDLLITDVTMPGGMDGVALAQRVRVLAKEIRVMFVTGDVEKIPSQLLDEGQMVMQKPIRLTDLSENIAKTLGRPSRTKTS